jgi:hypothetical protein
MGGGLEQVPALTTLLYFFKAATTGRLKLSVLSYHDFSVASSDYIYASQPEVAAAHSPPLAMIRIFGEMLGVKIARAESVHSETSTFAANLESRTQDMDVAVCPYRDNAIAGDYHERFINESLSHTRVPFVLLVNAQNAAMPFLAPETAARELLVVVAGRHEGRDLATLDIAKCFSQYSGLKIELLVIMGSLTPQVGVVDKMRLVVLMSRRLVLMGRRLMMKVTMTDYG